MRSQAGPIWIDLDNTPHVPFFRPIIRELEHLGYRVHVSARDAFQVCELADLLGVRYAKVGRHYGKHPVRKVLGLIWRSLQLLPFVLRHQPSLALSHGSRSQIFLCNLLRIPTVMIMDYEHARTPLLLTPRWEIVPAFLKHQRLQCHTVERVLTYDGIKEDVYAPEFRPDPSLCARLGMDPNRIVVTVRPPADEAHYHSADSDSLFVEFMNIALADSSVQIVLLPRNKRQEAKFRTERPQWFVGSSVIVPTLAVDGLNLLWHSDLAVSGGGTMNREAAALGIPVYSIFRGPSGGVDRQLANEGRLVLIEDIAELREKILFRKRVRPAAPAGAPRAGALPSIINHIKSIAARELSLRNGGSLQRAN